MTADQKVSMTASTRVGSVKLKVDLMAFQTAAGESERESVCVRGEERGGEKVRGEKVRGESVRERVRESVCGRSERERVREGESERERVRERERGRE